MCSAGEPASLEPPAPGRGVVFTPPDLADELARGLAGAQRVLDPACGDGALLLAALRLRGGHPGFARRSLFGIEIDPELAQRARERLRRAAGLPAGTELEEHIACADALDPALAWPPHTHVLANPPWVSFAGRRSAGRGLRPGPFRRGWPSLHGAFLVRIARHVGEQRSGARLILPAQVTELERYGPARLAATCHARPDRAPEELGEERFPGVVGPAVLVTLVPAAPGAVGSELRWTVLDHERGLLDELARFPRLGRSGFADPGVHTGNAARALVFDAPGPDCSPLRVGRDLAPFVAGRPSRFLRTDLQPGEGLRFRVGPIERYAAFPVLIRQTADRPIAALHEDPGYFRNSLLAARPQADLDPAFVVAVLNGPVAAAWHRLAWRDARQKAFPQVKVGHLASQPFPIARRGDDPALHDRLTRGARGLAGRAGADLERGRRALLRAALEGFGLSAEARERALAITCCRTGPSSRSSAGRPPRTR